jgi:3-deoxy-D-manno-octulosonate 8-phosphate phosphatase (KDO 8-P phosphatase)
MKILNLITDVDGVLTDGKYFYTSEGKIMKQFGPHDSDGVKILRSLGLKVSAITADHRGFEISKKRLEDMGVELTLVSEAERKGWVSKNYDLQTTAFVGDGLHDAPVMKLCALSFAPANALKITKNCADVITEASGGDGVLLEVALILMKRFDPSGYEELTGGLDNVFSF